jgi:hypothetical protein
MKFLSSFILLVCVVNITVQLSISETDKEKIKRKIEELQISSDTKENIKKKITEVINLFKEDISCKEPKWCEGFKVGDCETPLTNKTVCCTYCSKTNGKFYYIIKPFLYKKFIFILYYIKMSKR